MAQGTHRGAHATLPALLGDESQLLISGRELRAQPQVVHAQDAAERSRGVLRGEALTGHPHAKRWEAK